MARGVDQSDATAAKWYRKAAEQGYTVAQNNIGSMYENGQGVDQSNSTAANGIARPQTKDTHNLIYISGSCTAMVMAWIGTSRRRSGGIEKQRQQATQRRRGSYKLSLIHI